MDIKRCYIAGAGDFCALYAPRSDDLVIAADGGLTALLSHGVTPDIALGDFDSLGTMPENVPILRAPVEKDDTDMMIAVDYGLSQGCKLFIVDGGLGGRLDHTLANIQTLTYIARSGARGFLIGREICATVIKDGELRLFSGSPGRVSVFCVGGTAEGVTLRGLKYPLQGATLRCDYPIGVSNEFTGAQASVTVLCGELVIIWEGGAACAADLR